MYRGDLDAVWCARERVGARTQRTGSEAPGRTEPFGSSHEQDKREPTRERKNARSDGGEEGLACAAVAGIPRPARGTGRARRESDGVLFLCVASKDADDPDNPHQQKFSPTTRTRTRPGLAPHARARGRSDVDMSVVAVSYLCT